MPSTKWLPVAWSSVQECVHLHGAPGLVVKLAPPDPPKGRALLSSSKKFRVQDFLRPFLLQHRRYTRLAAATHRPRPNVDLRAEPTVPLLATIDDDRFCKQLFPSNPSSFAFNIPLLSNGHPPLTGGNFNETAAVKTATQHHRRKMVGITIGKQTHDNKGNKMA